MCKNLITHRVWARWDGGKEAPPAKPDPPPPSGQPHDLSSISSFMAGLHGDTAEALVCERHIEHFESGWSRMSGVDPKIIVVGHEPRRPPPPLPKGHNIVPELNWEGQISWGNGQYLPGYGLILNCRTFTPESAVGNPVTLHISEELIVPMLNLLKNAAAEQRRQTLAEAEQAQLDKAQ